MASLQKLGAPESRRRSNIDANGDGWLVKSRTTFNETSLLLFTKRW